MDLKNKKVLLIGLGILGGGLSMAKYLLAHGAKLTITDLRDVKTLEPMIKKLPKNVHYVLGKNPVSEIKKADIIILNPAVSAFSPIVKEIRKLKKEYYNDYTFFLKIIGSQPPASQANIIGITGTRGKTTTSLWTSHLIPGSILGGNIPEAGLLKILAKKTKNYVLELSSFQLEHITKKDPSPHIAIITNIYIDHLNRYKTMKRYSDMKKLIYANQTDKDFLIINNDESASREIEKDKPKSKIFYISLKKLPKSKNGLYAVGSKIYFQKDRAIKKVGNLSEFANHERTNFMLAALAAYFSGVSWTEIFRKSKNLPQAHLRQEIIYRKNHITVINDSAGTSPEATMAAIEKYNNKNIYLITGGTDKELEFSGLAKKISQHVNPSQIFLLSGSATNLLIDKFPKRLIQTGKIREYNSLKEIVKTISLEIKDGVVIFSPGAASFEKFKNEFDRGKKFNRFVKKFFS